LAALAKVYQARQLIDRQTPAALNDALEIFTQVGPRYCSDEFQSAGWESAYQLETRRSASRELPKPRTKTHQNIEQFRNSTTILPLHVKWRLSL
jgi:hypothetical protein